MFWIITIILTVYKLFLAGKDASSYLLKDKTLSNQGLTKRRINRWHRDGVILDLLFTGVTIWATGMYLIVSIISLLIRLSVYDLAFNKWASLPLTYLGSTATFDRIFSKIFGINGAIKKSLAFAAIILIWGLLKTIL